MTSRSLIEHRDDVIARLTPLTPLNVSLADAVGSVLAADAIALEDVPPVAIAACDGYAVRASDVAGAARKAVTLPVTQDVVPGHAPTRLARGAAARVARGATLPFGADAVVDVPTDDASQVLVRVPVAVGDGVTGVGAYANAGDVIAPAGDVVGPGHVAAMAAAGMSNVTVTPSPRVAIVAVGSELRSRATAGNPAASPAEPVPDASTGLLAALISSVGGRVVRTVVVADDPSAVRRAIEDVVLQSDLVVTLGGMSDDWQDIVMPVLSTSYGVERYAVRLSPGHSHGVGSVGDVEGKEVLLLALPGHPMDVAAAFAGYVRDAVIALRGGSIEPPTLEVGSDWLSPFGYAQVVPVVREDRDGKAVVTPTTTSEAGTLADLARADGLALVAEDVTTVAPPQRVDVVWWAH